MASRRNAKQSDIESMEKLAETGKVSPPKRTKLKSSIVKSKDTKSTKSTKSTKVDTAENNNEILKTELEPVKKLRTRNKADSTAKPAAKEQPIQEQTTKLKRVTKKSKPLTEDNLSSNEPNGVVDEANDEISKKISTKKPRAKKIPEKAGNTADINTVDDAKVKPNTRAKKAEALKEADSFLADTKEKKKNTAEKLPKSPKMPKETKTKVKPVKKVVEKNEAVIEEKKKAINTRTKTTKNNTKVVVNDEKKAKVQTTKKMQNQTDNVPDKTENNVAENNISKSVKGRSRKTNKDNVTNHSKKVHSKKPVAVNEEEDELEANKLILQEEEEEDEEEEEEEKEKEKEKKENEEEKEKEEDDSSSLSKEEEEEVDEPNEISKNSLQKAATNTSNLENDSMTLMSQ